MTSVFDDRCTERDAYEDDIIDIHNYFGDKFYDYHKAFSAKSAVLLRTKKVKVDWGKRVRDLLSLISAGTHINTCRHHVRCTYHQKQMSLPSYIFRTL
jgi:hypothetical protein